ncbi:MAG: hypothetical protein R3F17_11365 [Planctomycetota bacterium]
MLAGGPAPPSTCGSSSSTLPKSPPPSATSRVEREAALNKLRSEEIAHAIVTAMQMDPRGFIPELAVFATNSLVGLNVLRTEAGLVVTLFAVCGCRNDSRTRRIT